MVSYESTVGTYGAPSEYRLGPSFCCGVDGEVGDVDAEVVLCCAVAPPRVIVSVTCDDGFGAT